MELADLQKILSHELSAQEPGLIAVMGQKSPSLMGHLATASVGVILRNFHFAFEYIRPVRQSAFALTHFPTCLRHHHFR